MRSINTILFIIIFTFAAFGQKPDEILATSTGHTIRLRDLPPAIQKAVSDYPANLPKIRTNLFEQMVNEKVLELEAKERGVTQGRLIAAEKAKIPAPSEIEIKALYEAKRREIGSRTLEEVRKAIIDYLRNQAEQKMLGTLLTSLKTKYKVTGGKEVNAIGLAQTEVLVTINGQPVTLKDFEDFAKIPLFQDKADLADSVVDAVTETLYNLLLADEAKSLGIDEGTLIGREITNKLKEFSTEERAALTDALGKRLFAKYQVNMLYTAPEPMRQNISVGTSPATGPANAPVTVVMFSDFQCSACSATHPVLKKAMESYPGKIRFVVRNFPLEGVHLNAWRAALAAEAANAQGKFFEYIEILYAHQDALDDASLKKYAADLGLNVKQFELDFNSEKTAAAVKKDMADGEFYGVSGTPAIYVNGIWVRSLTVEAFKAAIDKALGSK
ncbi:MAG: thioredoxin domain-containing protein [Chloracidobacterium sp.]|nr:thioredoxin domain-containing protein [Chloracidobacterium sp.]